MREREKHELKAAQTAAVKVPKILGEDGRLSKAGLDLDSENGDFATSLLAKSNFGRSFKAEANQNSGIMIE